jgi:sugar lactone lactonase YvrE
MDDANEDRIDSALGVAVAASGMVFVADVTAYRVRAYRTSLSERLWSFGQESVSDDFKQRTACTVRPSRAAAPFLGASCFNPHSLAWSERVQKLYVADADNGALFVLSGHGELVRIPRSHI